MLSAEVIINRKSRNFDQTYTYSVPESLLSEVACGCRVLVPLGTQQVEGYVRSLRDLRRGEDLKPVIAVLDKEAVLDERLFQLADWMADYYISPISTVLSLMVPPAKSRKKLDLVIYNESEGDLLAGMVEDEISRAFLDELRKQGSTSAQEAVQRLGMERYIQLKNLGVIQLVGRYAPKRLIKQGWVYRLKNQPLAEDLAKMEKRAPRQREILSILSTRMQIDCQALEKQFSGSSIQSLLQQNLIERVKAQPELRSPDYRLTRRQAAVIAAVGEALKNQQFTEFLLHGVTGSGKTEVYLHCAQKAIKRGKQVIVLVPEIALTEHLIKEFSSRIAGTSVWHSGMTPLERYHEWKQIRSGAIHLVLGTRSAIFAPLPDLGMIIVDEEQEASYKQEEGCRYHAREVARRRCQLESAVILLGSATPALESYFRTAQNQSHLLSLPDRVEGMAMPKVIVEDMKPHLLSSPQTVLSPFLTQRVQAALENQEQSILFLNRRGYSPMTICRECGMIATCPHCSVGLNYHEDLQQYICHYCNYQTASIPCCPGCHSRHIARVGLGTQKVAEEVSRLFPQARVARLDLDSSRRKGSVQKILSAMTRGDIDILVGTQMVAKGLDFPMVSLVGIVYADGMLNLPDFRAGERTFQLLVQAAGRSGRGLVPGEVIMQTFQPDHPVIRMAADQDYQGFFVEEIQQRKCLEYPPYTHLLRIEISSNLEDAAWKTALFLKELIEERMDATEEEVQILGPAPSPIRKLRGRYRFQLVLKTDHRSLLQSLGANLSGGGWQANVRVVFDMDPGMMM